MIKKFFLFIVVLSAFLFVSFGVFYAEEAKIQRQNTYIFPVSLQEVEEEAFSGTAAEIIVFPEGLLRIGEKAFNGAEHLTDVYIPGTTVFIADTAFSITSDLTIHGIDESYAQEWAKKNKVCFAADNVWNVAVQNWKFQKIKTDPIDGSVFIFFFLILFETVWVGCFDLRSRRPQDRPELNPIEYRFP